MPAQRGAPRMPPLQRGCRWHHLVSALSSWCGGVHQLHVPVPVPCSTVPLTCPFLIGNGNAARSTGRYTSRCRFYPIFRCQLTSWPCIPLGLPVPLVALSVATENSCTVDGAAPAVLSASAASGLGTLAAFAARARRQSLRPFRRHCRRPGRPHRHHRRIPPLPRHFSQRPGRPVYRATCPRRYPLRCRRVCRQNRRPRNPLHGRASRQPRTGAGFRPARWTASLGR